MNPELTLQNVSDLAASVSNQAIVTPLGDPYTIGISGLIFDIVEDVSIEVDSDITDHYVEANYAIQDHWSQKPVRVAMQGKAAEVVAVYQPSVLQQIFSAVVGLVTPAGLSPAFNAQDASFYATLSTVAQLGQNIVNTALSAFQVFTNAATLVTRQQTVFQFLFNMWQTRQLATVETPYAVFENMAIESLRPIQSADTTKVSDFIVRFKQIVTVNAVQGTSNANSTDSQNAGTTSTIPPAASVGLAPYVSNPVSLGSGYGTTVDTNATLSTFTNQAAQ